MRIRTILLPLLLALASLVPTQGLLAIEGPKNKKAVAVKNDLDFRANCDNAVSQIDMEVNNVRARLTTGGDVWYDGANGRYIVPKPPPGVPEVSSIFAGAVWLGGRDPGGGLKVAAQTYGRNDGSFDYYPGPLTENGTVEKDTCARWDKFFVVSGESIRQHLAAYQEALETDNLPLDPSTIPQDIMGWPASGNEFFFDIHNFDLPTDGGLAGFWDQDFDGAYEPEEGDYPIIQIRGCNETPQFPEEMTFWIYNDAGNTHRQSGTPNQIQMEIQVQAFAYTTSDDINNMTFMRYKLINRAQEDILDTYFAMWVDPDLGCSTDDYVGCDTTRSLAYVYNQDELDGANGCTCDGGVETYCDEVPILGIDYFRGPRGFETIDGQRVEVELGMSSFIFYNRGGPAGGGWPDATTDPNTAEEYYNYLTGRWRDGAPYQNCGDGYDEPANCEEILYAYPDAPDDPNGTSMAALELQFGDRRSIQASGPFTLEPGAVNELIVGVVWVPDQQYPNPSIRRLQQADDLAQSLFDECFNICDGPDAPDVDIIELDREIVLQFSNGPASNNFGENYIEPGLGIPMGEDSLYRFEGYRVFQFVGPDVGLADIGDPDRVREVATFDIQNGVTRLFNWNGLVDSDQTPLSEPYFVPELQVAGQDEGIRHSISITDDAFASDNTRLINHRRYYFTVVAYAYNNYKSYDPLDRVDPGQPVQYKASTRNIGDELTGQSFYTVIPRPNLDRQLMAEYGQSAIVARVSGEGNGGNFLDLSTETVEAMEDAFAAGATRFAEPIVYQPGAAPIEVFVSNPREITNGQYEITFIDEDMTDEDMDAPVMWTLRCLNDCGEPTIVSEVPISRDNEQLVPEFGFSVRVTDVPEVGNEEVRLTDNGAIGAAVTYDDTEAARWLLFVPDNLSGETGFAQLDNIVYDYVATEFQDEFEDLDPERALTELSPGIYPWQLMNWTSQNNLPFISPVYLSENRRQGSVARSLELGDLRSVDIVFTSDKSLWTRCPVVETSNFFYKDVAFDGRSVKTDDDPLMFDTRDAPSVTREAGDDGLPEQDRDIDPDLARGMGWFPGYAVDVETGVRLQVFWGENSLYDGRTIGDFTADDNGADMIWNPSSNLYDQVEEGLPNIYDLVSGGEHFFYVTQLEYDEGVFLEGRLEPRGRNSTRKVNALREVIYAGFPLLQPGVELLSYEEGLIPTDATVKIRVNNDFDFADGTDDANGYPTYRFTFDGVEANTEIDAGAVARQLDAINVVPNPYYGFSSYEDSQFETNVKITNLPPRATVTIYTLDGKFVRQYDWDETPTQLRGDNRPIGQRQVAPALEWDLRNSKQIPVGSGVYLIHVDAPGFGERTLKFFGVQRQFDPSGL